MKLHNTFLTLLVLFASFQFSFGQEELKAELIDEFGNLNCEELIARQDNLLNRLQQDITATGYIVIYDNINNSREGYSKKRYFDGQTEFRNFDETRLKVIRGKAENELRIQFWLVPENASKPDFNELEWDFDLSNYKKAFVFYSPEWGDGPCPTGLQLKTYSAYLTSNTGSSGNIVIFTNSQKKFQKEKRDFIKKLSDNYKVSQTALNFFFKKTKTDFTYHELWIVPPKKK